MVAASPARLGPWWRRREVLLWALGWCVLRAILLLSFCDVFVYGEEFEKGAAGKALLDGVPIPYHLLPYHPYEGGGFVVSALDALAFAVFGQSLLAIKLVALGFGAAVLWAGWSLCERFGGRAAARAFALLCIFAPESVQTNSLLALGIHYQACLFVALILGLALRAALQREARQGPWIALGLAAGFGFYFSYQCALTIAVAGGVLLLAWKRELFGVRLAWLALGVLVGLTPLLWMALNVGNEVFDIHGASVVGSKTGKLDVLTKFAQSLFEGRSAWDCAAIVLLALAPLLALVTLRGCESRALRWAMLAVAAHALVFLAAYLASGFTIAKVFHYFYLHRLMPLWFLGILLVALGVARARWMWGPVALLALMGASDTWRLARDATPGDWFAHARQLAEQKGYRYSQYLQKIEPRMQEARLVELTQLLAFDEPEPELLHESLAIALYGSGVGSFEDQCAEIRSAGIDDLRGFQLGMGLMLMRHKGRDFKERVDLVSGFEPATRDALIESIGRFGQWELGTEDTVLREARLGLELGFPEPFFRGLGRRLFSAIGDARIPHYFERRASPVFLVPARAQALLAELPDAARVPMLAGYEHAVRMHALP